MLMVFAVTFALIIISPDLPVQEEARDAAAPDGDPDRAEHPALVPDAGVSLIRTNP